MDQRDAATRLLLGSFRWTDGHADFSDVFRAPELIGALGPALAQPFIDAGITAVLALEARGFLLGGLVARELGVGVVLVRKPGAVHPDSERAVAATPDWRGRQLELLIRRQALRTDDRLLLVDDWIQTGSQARTVAHLVSRAGATLVGVSVLVDDTTDQVRDELGVVGLVPSSRLGPSAP
jgi:adenine phosphoribosyltransferase